MKAFLGKRDGWWHYVRRVPAVYAEHDLRGIVRRSTKVRIADDPRGIAAAKVAAKINADVETYWRGLFLGQPDHAQQRYEASRRFTQALGFDAVPAAELLERPAEDVVARVKAIGERGIKPASDGARAALGLVQPPALKLSGLVTAYEALQRATLSGKAEDQLQRWRTTKERAVNLLIEVSGDLRVDALGRSHALDFRDYWQERIDAGEVEIDTANKAIGHLNKMWRELNRVKRLGLDPIFAELRIEGGGAGQRAAYDASYVQDKLLAPGAFGELNDEARRILFLIADTGLRLSEAVNLSPETIRLAAPVPHIAVEPDGRQMKTDDSRRTIPLVGAALAAMTKQPAGFPRYRGKAASLSALANKILHDKKLRPTPRHTVYSLRHCFEDRLTAVEAPEKLIAALMGHKYSRPKYGAGPSLEQKRDWLARIAFTAPADV